MPIKDLPTDHISRLPDECLALIFSSLTPSDRNRCSLVSHTWLCVDAQSRHRLSLNAAADIIPHLTRIFSRFDSVTKLALKCDRRSISIGDDALVLISRACPSLTRLKLRACRELTPSGMSQLAQNCKVLKKLSCGSLTFGADGINAVVNNSGSLEELSVKRLRGVTDAAGAAEPIGPGLYASSLKLICLKELYNGQCFGPLIIASKNLKTLKLFRCSGDWDKLLQAIAERIPGVVEVHLERLQVSDTGLVAISNCPNLETLHIVKTPECTNFGLKSIAENCRLLRKLHIDGWKTNRIGDDGLISVAKHCPNLQELVLIGVNSTLASLGLLATNCVRLERLALCGSDTVGDAEISCIATRCVALRKLCIKSCPLSDLGIEALASGCPNLVKVKVKKCRGITIDGADWLRTTRESVDVNLDVVERENPEASASDRDGTENVVEPPAVAAHDGPAVGATAGRSRSFKARLGLIAGRNLVSSTFRRWSSFGGSSSRSS